MPEHLTDFVITKVYEPKKDGKPIEGEGEYGPWKLYNFHTDKTAKEKFSFMWGGKKPIPTEGLKIKHMEYEEEKKGQYTNLSVKKLELADNSKPAESTSTSSSPATYSGGNAEVSYWVRYISDIAIAIIANGGNLETADLDDIAKKIGRAGLIMMKESLGNGQNTPSKSSEGGKAATKQTPPPLTTPENEELSKKLQTYALADKKRYFAILGQHGATRASEVFEFAPDAQVSLLDDLAKELGDIPF